MSDVAMLEQRQRELTDRLEAGFRKIGEAMAEGVAVGDWERLWIDLLREYEALHDELERAQAQPQPVTQATLDLRAERVA